MKGKVLITGATGATGSSAIEKLLELKIPVRAMVHALDDRSALLTARGVEVVQGDLLDFNSVRAALEGISRAYFVYPIQVSGLLEATAYFAQASLEEKLDLVINMSQVTASRNIKSHAAQGHWIAERVFDWSGLPVVHLRPTLFAEWLQYFARQIREKNILLSPFGDASYAPLAGEDTGRVIAGILAAPAGHAGQTYPLYGPQELTQYEIADLLSGALGRKITYMPMEIAAFSEVLKTSFTPYFIQHIAAISQDFRDGTLTGSSDWVEKITGTKPMPTIDYINKNIALFK